MDGSIDMMKRVVVVVVVVVLVAVVAVAVVAVGLATEPTCHFHG